MQMKGKWLILAGLMVLAGLFAAFGLKRNTQAQHFTAKVERGEIHDVVEATGTINAVITVQVGSQVSGTISKLNVDFNSRVHKGDIVALIEPALFKGALLQAAADLENAKANLAAAQANLEKAKSAAVQAKADFDRTAALAQQGVMSQQQLDLAIANWDSANATVGGALANVTQAEAQVSQKSAAVSVAPNESRLHGDPIADRRDGGGAQCGRRTNGSRVIAGTDYFHHRPGLDQDAGIRQDGRVGCRQHQTGDARHLQGGCLPQGDLSRSCQPDSHECDHSAKRGHLRHDHRVREP